MTPRAVRAIVVAVCVGGVAGMIITTILHHSGAALTFGIITVIAVLCLIVATAVVADSTSVVRQVQVSADAATARLSPDAEAEAAEIEQQVAVLIADGADERRVRDLVREAVRLGRSMGPTATPP
jgi:hypothetical protein